MEGFQLSRRLPIPVALVVTKADILPGFSGDDQVVLVNPEDESVLSQDFESFLERVLNSNKMDANPIWAGTVRDVMVKLAEFLKVIIGRTLNFQVFFVSSTGQQPTKIGTDVGRSIYAPPEKITPIGIKEPFHWLLQAVVKNRKYRTMGKISKWAAILCVIWIAVFSIPYVYNFWFKLPGATGEEDAVLEAHIQRTGSVSGLSSDEVNRIKPSTSISPMSPVWNQPCSSHASAVAWGLR